MVARAAVTVGVLQYKHQNVCRGWGVLEHVCSSSDHLLAGLAAPDADALTLHGVLHTKHEYHIHTSKQELDAKADSMHKQAQARTRTMDDTH